MPELHPFRAVRYTAVAGHPDDLLAPPYDVIDPAEAAALRARSPLNSVHLELPEGEAPDRYELAAHRLTEWLERDVLVQDSAAAVYAYRQGFTHAGARRERRSLVAVLRLVPLDGKAVVPHEETHGDPKRDRLALTLACRAQLSPVFLLAPDPEGRLLNGLRAADREGEAVLEAHTDDGIRHRMARLDGASPLAGDLCRAAGASPLLIADGHHRYETALAVAEELPDSEAAGCVLVCVVPEADPGVLLLPTHRALRLPSPADGWAGALAASFETSVLEGREAADDALAPGSGELAFVAAGQPRLRLRPRPEAFSRAGISAAGRRVAALAFDRLVVRGLVGSNPEELARRGALTYHRHAREAARSAGSRGAAFLMAATRPGDVRDAVAETGERLPPKTTYFWPKVPAGLLFRRI